MKGKYNLYEKSMNVVLDVLIFLFGLILLISIYNGIQVKLLGNEYSNFFGYSIFEVQTGSMAKAINAGDWIVVKSTNDVKLDDIITFKQNDEFITHRVVESYKGTYVTKGDANPSKDEPISQEQIIGKVINILPLFGIFRKTLFNPFVLITLIITVYLFGYVLRKNKKNVVKDKNNEEKALMKIDGLFTKLMNLTNSKKDKTTLKEKRTIEKSTKEKRIKELSLEEDKETVKVSKILPTTKEEKISNEEVNNILTSDDDLDKTLYFRAIHVDKNEINNTFLEIAKNQIDDDKKTKDKNDIMEEEIEIDDSIIQSNLELLQKKKQKRFNNIKEKIMFLKEEELNEIISLIRNNEKTLVNEVSIKNELMKAYIDVKYYNYCGDVNVSYNNKNMTIRVIDALNKISEDMIANYKGTDNKYSDKVKKIANIYVLVMYIEQANASVSSISALRELYSKKIVKLLKNIDEEGLKKLVNEIIKTQRIYSGMIKISLKKLETNTFNVLYNQLTMKKNVYAVSLEHNLAFSKVYSDYIVDKTYSEGIIAEDKLNVLMSLLSMRLVNDMLDGNFKNNYIVYIPETIYAKEKKLSSLLKLMNDEHTKNSVLILIRYKELIQNKKVVKELRKMGYRFSIVFDEDTSIKEKDKNILYISDYIFMTKKNVDTTKITPMIPEDLIKNIIYEDIGTKVGNYGGE